MTVVSAVVLFVLSTRFHSSRPVEYRVRDSLVEALAGNGKVVWKHDLQAPGEMVGLAYNALNSYLVIHRHQQRQPFDKLSLIDAATGRLQGEYAHLGRIVAIEIVDLDEDGIDEVVFGGENGHRSGRGALGVLRVPFPPHGKERKSDRGHEMAYVLFPSPKISRDEHQRLVVQRIYATEEGLLVGLGEEPFPPFLYYCLNRRLELLRVYAPKSAFEGIRPQS